MRPDQNELWERYEDAMFTLLMDEVAHQEGQEQLEWKKQLNNDPSAALPEEVRKKGEQTSRKAFAAQSRRSARHVGFRMFQRIAVAVMIVILTAVCAFAAFPEMRSNVINTVIKICEDHTDITFADMGDGDCASKNYQITPNWLPEGFELSEEGDTSVSIWKLYRNTTDGNIYISETTAENNSMAVDTEDAKVSQIKIKNYDATLVIKDEMNWNCLIFSIPEKGVVIYIDSEFIPYQDIIRVAEELSVN